jgi:hypothetical protein
MPRVLTLKIGREADHRVIRHLVAEFFVLDRRMRRDRDPAHSFIVCLP